MPGNEDTAAGPVVPQPQPKPEEDDEDDDEIINFRIFDVESWSHQLQNEEKAHVKAEENKKNQGEAHLVDGELKFDSEEDHGKKLHRNPDLIEGCTLPEGHDIDKALYGKPLEEIDILSRDKTFVVIAPRFKKEYIYRFSSTPSFYLFTPWNLLRKHLVYVATNQYFDYFIVLTILTNCIFLAMPEEDASVTAEYIFLAVYTVEMIIKLIARGFIISSYTYLRDAWNWLDFIVIVLAYITIVLEYIVDSDGLGNLQGIRTFRVFRILRTVSIVPGLKTIVNALLRAFRLLLEVMMLIVFCLMMFALFALQFYRGVLRQKCVADLPAFNATTSYSHFQYYNDFVKNSTNWHDDDGDYRLCGNATGSRSCPGGFTCLPDIGDNPNWGYTSFDHFGWAMLTSFQLITLDFWEDTYNKVLQASGPWNVLFFVLVVFFGSFYLVNLMLAVVAMSYEEEAESAGKTLARQQRVAAKASAAASAPPPAPPLPSTQTNKMLAMFRSYDDEDEEKEKETKARNKKIKKKQESNALKDLAIASRKAAKEGAAMAVHHNDHQSTHSSPEKPKSDPNKTASPGRTGINTTPVVPIGSNPAVPKRIQRNPMVKYPSKDSGTGNSLESTRSNGSNGDDGIGSSLDGTVTHTNYPPKKPFLRNPSSGMVSQSGVTLEKKSMDDFEEELEPIPDKEDKDDEETIEEEEPISEGKVYVETKYTDIVVIDVEEDYDITPSKGEYINRNCMCCYNCCKGRLMVPWLKVQSICYSIIMEPLFDLLILLCIILNTIFMSLEHYEQPDVLTTLLDISNKVFTVIFTIEAVLKLSCLARHYFKVGWNIFDLVIVIASLVDLGVENIDGLSVLRTFRLLRVFKLAQSWPTMRLLLSIILNTLGALANLTGVLAIVIYIFAVIGLQLFNKSYTVDKFDPDPIPRWNFNDIQHSFMMIFRVLCGEWIEPLWDCMRASSELCMAVFLPTLVIGNFIVLNLFLALLLNAFASDSLRKAKADNEDNRLILALHRVKDLLCCCFKKKSPRPNSVGPDEGDVMAMEEIEEGGGNKIIVKPHENGTSKADDTKPQDSSQKPNGVIESGKKVEDNSKKFDTKRDQFADFNKERKKGKAADDTKVITTAPTAANGKASGSKDKDHDDLELGDEASTIKNDETDAKTGEEDEEEKIVIHDCFPHFCTKRLEERDWCMGFCAEGTTHGNRWLAFRTFLHKVVEHKVFETIILLLIMASSISLAFEDVNLYTNVDMVAALYYLNIIFAVLFAVEMILKMLAFGFHKYFTSFWTILDFMIVVISFVSLIAEASGSVNLSAFRSLRTLRALRPLRAISRWQGMRIVVNALMMAIPAIFQVLMVILVFWLIFSIMGVQFFKGQFFKCVDADGARLSIDIVKDKVQCLQLNYKWENSKINFDNAGIGYLALFQVATFEGWMEVMADAVDVAGIDNQPSEDNAFAYYLYFVIFIIFGSFFTLNLLIGVIIDNFNMLKKKYDGSILDMFLTPGQRQYYNTIKKLGNKKPRKTIRRPKNKIQAIFYDIGISTKFELCVVIVICFNMIGMAVEHYKQSEVVSDVLDMLNILFVVIFALEAIVKIIGLRLHYFREPWNIFDFVVVVLSIVGIILDDVLTSAIANPTLLRVVRVFRIGRVLRLIKAAKGIRKLLFALIISLPALLNIGALLVLVLYIYSIICLNLFQNLKVNGAMDEDVVNYKTFFNSFTLLFRIATSAGWNDILDAMMIQAPDCNPNNYTRTDGIQVADGTGDCGIPWLAIAILTSYIIIIFLVIINMFIAVILENFNQAHEQEEVGITEDDFDMFYSIWERYDPLATQFIKYEQLSNFVADLEKPLGIDKPNEIALVSFDLPISEGDKLHCLDILMALVRYVLGNVEETPEFKELHEQMEVSFQQAFPTRVNTTKKSSTMSRKKEDVAAKTLQRAWRSWKAQKQLKNITAMAMQRQNQNKTGLESRTRGNSIMNLGHRVSNALRGFFTAPRPSSALSRVSVKSIPTAGPSTSSTVKKKTSHLEPPKVSVLYLDNDKDVEL